MGKIVRQGVEYGGSSNSADCIKYNDTKSVKEAIDEIKASSISNPTAASVTFDNTDTGLAAANVQDAVTEVNGKLTKQPTEKVEIQTVTGDADVTIENLSQYKYIQITVTATSCYGGFVLIPVDYLLISGTNWGAVHSENIGSSNYFATCGYRFENSVCYIRNLRCGSGAANPRVIITGVK